MPGYGKMTAGASRGFWLACADNTQIWQTYQAGSLLACNFNQLWCSALNIVHGGGRVDYFAMLHDDIAPQDYWLDKLIDELEANNLDVLGAVVPIKDTRGMTSLALHGEDNWLPHARLSMYDVYELPETFTSDDIGHPLLLNTGCWVAKWNQEWCRQVHFEINDRIVFNRAANRYQAQTEPEDWFFSRLCHEQGLKIGATRKIALMHDGDISFPNQQPWGSHAFDREAVKVSPVPGAFPWDIEGWLEQGEGMYLAELARGKRVLEVGSYHGLSTVCMARTAKHVTSVDPHDSRECLAAQVHTFDAFKNNLVRYGVWDKVLPIVDTLEDAMDALLAEDKFDLIFIDAAHDEASVQADIEMACELLAHDGLLVFHDYNRAIDPGVTAAVDEFINSGAELLSTHNTLAVVRPPAAIPLEV